MSWWWLILLAIFLIVILIILYFVFRDTSTPQDSEGNPILIPCEKGQCVTNLISGNKACPDDSSTFLTYDPLFQTCNYPFTCDSSLTPFAVNNDLSTNSSGVCPTDVVCKCLQNAQCAYNILVAFELEEGNNFWNPSSQNLVLQQRYAYQNSANDTEFLPPITIPDQDTFQCTVSNDQVPRIWPKLCARGILAYLPEDASSFTTIQDANVTSLGCVPGDSCVDQTAVWDTNTNKVICKQICPNGQLLVWDDNLKTLVCM